MTGFNYIGMGNSTNKKDAQTNAARDFLNYLVRVNEIKSEEIPAFGVSDTTTCRICVIFYHVWCLWDFGFFFAYYFVVWGREAVFLLITLLKTFFQNVF